MKKPKKSNCPELSSVFASITEGKYTKPLYDVFINESEKVSAGDDLKEYKKLVSEYSNIVHDEKFIKTIEHLSLLETKILMYRSSFRPEISLGIQKLYRNNTTQNYLYARCTLYSPHLVKNEVRVYMGRMEDYGETIDDIRMNVKLMEEVKKMVVEEIKNRIPK